jgi:hypothetical protein
MDEMVLRIITSLGVPGLVAFLMYRLADKYLGKFLEVHDRQATAITDLAHAVQKSSTESQDVIMAVRVLASKVDDCIGWLSETKTKGATA